jgi:hypothetical protein
MKNEYSYSTLHCYFTIRYIGVKKMSVPVQAHTQQTSCFADTGENLSFLLAIQVPAQNECEDFCLETYFSFIWKIQRTKTTF